ncbi:DNA-binding transcriptional regulator [Coraliomargarita sp. SDUM461004]|uniref:DNA-binding transcriptional regulator n=1 Tax=Thalassobacterium sedimentorum TaxID=3041258 RepID=A0ABU1AFK2_9BACT|nr:DNA-binding transcriptional regulator [Coraliomargarita sp. SDUM461004]MDQ8193607.1 DNA-binding transcriptional regulator [Coraliomargarita sp. SDUM461004]
MIRTQRDPRPCILLALGWYSPAIHRGIAHYARRANWILDTSMARDGSIPRSVEVDGIISLLHHNMELHDFVASCGLPVVNIGDIQLAGVPTVRCDDAAIGRLAAEHFISRGFRHAAYYRYSTAASAHARQQAFTQALAEAGIECDLIIWPGDERGAQEPEVSNLFDWLGQEVSTLPRPLAIFSEHDEISIQILHVCRNLNIPVPEQVAVLGVDDDPLRCDFAPVPLSSVDNNQEAEGYQAAALLDRMLRGDSVTEREIVIAPVRVTPRLSTDILAVKHVHVASVLHYIWQNYTGPINAKTVAATVPLSYRRLHDAFQEELGRSIAEEITLKRLEKAQTLLVKTDLRAHEIALECGFPSEDRMGRVFRRILNQTPRDYRKRNCIVR